MNDPAKTPGDPPARLDQIATRWSLLRLAHQDTLSVAGPARNTLALRYSGAIRAYVGALVQDGQDADELAQEVLVRILRGDLKQAKPERGRFRDLLKAVIRNLARSHWARQQRRAGVEWDLTLVADDADEGDSEQDRQWLATWRRSVLDKTWAALEDYERTHKGSVSYTVLRLKTDKPGADSGELAECLGRHLGRPYRPEALRQQLHRARLRFAQFLLEEVARVLDDPTPRRVEEELIEVGLMDYVRDFLPEDWRTTGELKEVL
jgi:RNA polymerase sigma factor (sigma-70 family)